MSQQSSAMRAGPSAYSLIEEPKKVQVDTNPSDQQPPGVDEEDYNSLEEALLGES